MKIKIIKINDSEKEKIVCCEENPGRDWVWISCFIKNIGEYLVTIEESDGFYNYDGEFLVSQKATWVSVSKVVK